tara:strand:- start:847 stop:1539 length:693 start_codon:yes stop_codon:yes gene_type:complete
VKKKYNILRKVISKELCEFLKNYFLESEKVAKLYFATEFISQFNTQYGVFNDPQVEGSYAIHGSIVGDMVLQQLKPLVEKNLKKKLYETYSYARVYKKGNTLDRHKDRLSCKISVTLNLDGEEWPIFIEGNSAKGKATHDKETGAVTQYTPGNTKGEKVILKAGDMLLYEGSDLEHWREPLKKGKCVQLFLHYVDVKYKDAEKYKHDGRPMLGVDTLIRKEEKDDNPMGS